MSFRFNVITLFPEMIHSAMSQGVVGQALGRGLAELVTLNPRDFTSDRHRTVDDRPFGGSDGMLMLAEPLERAIESLGPNRGRVVGLSPKGQLWSDELAQEWASQGSSITLICGRYAGFDQRIVNTAFDNQVSIGDYVLSGGELPALVIMDSTLRFVPEVLGHPESAQRESFRHQLLEEPQFTRPREYRGQEVPAVLLSGHHQKIQAWRQNLSLVVTAKLRPDLIDRNNPELVKRLLRALDALSATSEAELLSCGLSLEVLEELKVQWVGK